MIHYDNGGDNAGNRYFWDHIRAEGVPFDVIGLSYYSFWHGHLTDLKANVNDLAARYGKQIMIAEIQYAWTLGYGDSRTTSSGRSPSSSRAIRPRPAGQLSFVNDVLSILDQVPDHLGQGLFYWEPEWVPGRGLAAGRGHAERQPDPVRLPGPRPTVDRDLRVAYLGERSGAVRGSS